MIIKEKGGNSYLFFWRGDITETLFNLLLENTKSGEIITMRGLVDKTPSRLIILTPRKDEWDNLPIGEYKYSLQHKGKNLRQGLLKIAEKTENISYDTEDIYTEYRAE